jgi:hypothetical protein
LGAKNGENAGETQKKCAKKTHRLALHLFYPAPFPWPALIQAPPRAENTPLHGSRTDRPTGAHAPARAPPGGGEPGERGLRGGPQAYLFCWELDTKLPPHREQPLLFRKPV